MKLLKKLELSHNFLRNFFLNFKILINVKVIIYKKINSASRVQIQNKAVCISFSANALGSGMNTPFPPKATGKNNWADPAF